MPNEEERQPQEAGPASGSKSRKAVFIGFILVAIAGLAYGAYLKMRPQVSTDDAQVDAHISSVAAKISGNVLQVLVEDNQQVKAGQVLVRIDPRDFQARVDIAKAELARAENQLKSAEVTVPWTEAATGSGANAATAQISDAEAELQRAQLSYEQTSGSELGYAEANVKVKQAQNDRAQADLARMKPLAEKAEISQQQYDAYVAAARVAESDLKASQEKLSSVQKDAAIRKAAIAAAQSRVNQARAGLETAQANQKQVAVRSADVATASAAVQQARANLAAAELQLSYTTIAAPTDGVVTRKSVEVGHVVAPGQGLMAIVPLKGAWVVANFKETQLADVRPGQRAEVDVDMYGKTFEAKVDSIAGATGARMSLLPPENATGNFVKVVQRIPVKLVIEDTHGYVLRAGTNVNATIFIK